MAVADTSTTPSAAAVGRSRPTRDVRGFWRTAAAVVTPLPVLALAAQLLLAPFPPDADFGRKMTDSAAHPGAAGAGLWLAVVFALLMIPATMAVAWVARRGAPRLALAGGLLTLVAFAAGTTLPNSELAALIAAGKGLDPALATALDEAVWAHPAVGLRVLVFLIGQAIGLVLLGLALWRSRAVPAWVGGTLAVSGPAHLLLPPLAGGAVAAAVSWALTAVGYAGASVALLRMGNDGFDLPPAGQGDAPGGQGDAPAAGWADAPGGSRPARDVRTVWRVLLAVTAPFAALYVALARYLLPYDMSDPPREIFDKLVAATEFQATSIWLGSLVSLVGFTGVVAVAWVTRRRAPLLTTAAVLLALPGYLALFAPGQYGDVLGYVVGTQAGLDREAAFQLGSGMEASAWSVALGGIFVAGHLFGTILLGLALWRARVVPTWLAIGLAVSQPIHLTSVIIGIRWLDLVGWGLTAVGFATVGWLLLRLRNDQFDLPPTGWLPAGRRPAGGSDAHPTTVGGPEVSEAAR